MIKPLFDNILLKKVEEEKSTASGIVLAANEETSNIGIVVALGERCLLSKDNEGELSEGSKVVFSDEFKKVSFKNEVFYLVNEEEVLALIEE